MPSATLLPFSPVKLALLVGWVYLCLYLVQRVQFSALVSKKYKPVANITTLFTGPVLLLLLQIIETIRNIRASDENFIKTIMEQLQNLIASIKSSGFVKPRNTQEITLLNSSGRSIKDIYGQDKNQKQRSHILELTEQIVLTAINDRASDILIDPRDEANYTVRYRVDGMLRLAYEIDTEVSKAVINSIKAVSDMDIAERRRPQDGSFIAKIDDSTCSFRVSSAGVINGEKLSIRILNRQAASLTINDIGFSQKQQKVIRDAISKPAGMILICGPTGSGKTTTMYGMLNEIDFFTHNVITVEDPIECVLPNTSQIEVNPKADITFAKTLRSMLRQDPDVICVGEIRDEETASIALRAAQTGHLVMATLHCNSNASALVRLMDLGITPLLLASGLSVLISQRLVRKLCSHCKTRAELTPSQIHDFRRRKINYANIFQANGCEQCNGTGYYGRTAICDILVLNDALKNGIVNNEMLLAQLKKEGDQKGKSNLQKQGVKKIVSGITGLEELKRVVG